LGREDLKVWRKLMDLSTHFGVFFEFCQKFAAELQKLASFSILAASPGWKSAR
jgi:hypothetical protein